MGDRAKAKPRRGRKPSPPGTTIPYQDLIDSSPIPILIGREGIVLYGNQAAARLLGAQTPSEVIGQRLLSPLEAAIEREAAQSRDDSAPLHLVSGNLVTIDGSPLAVQALIAPLTYHDQPALQIIALDRTLHPQPDENAPASDRRLHQLLDSISDVCYVIDRKWRYAHLNLAASQITPHKKRDLIGMHVADFYASSEDGLQLKTYKTVMETGKPHSFTTSNPILPDCLPGTFEVRAFPVPEGVLCMARDVTEILRAQAAERAQRALAESLRDTAAALTSTLELDSVLGCILTNVGRVVPHDAATIMLIDSGVARVVRQRGYERYDPEGRIFGLRFTVSEVPNFRAMCETGQPIIIPDVASYPNWIAMEPTAWVRSYAGMPIRLEGDVLGFINLDSAKAGFFDAEHIEVLRAFADQVAIAIRNAQLYQTIRQQVTELEKRNSELDAFIYTVAHDLKSPLHIILGYSSLIADDFADLLPKDAQIGLRHIQAYAVKMDEMIHSLLVLARLRNADDLQAVKVEIRPILDAVQDRFAERIQERGVAIEIAAELPPVLGHRVWLEEVFANLIDNAIKYTGQDNPTPWVKVRGARLGSMVRYEVQDNGVGIAPEDQARLFEMFTRFHKEQASGAGLGLSIVQRIISKLKGQVGVISEVGKGSTFWFELPAADA